MIVIANVSVLAAALAVGCSYLSSRRRESFAYWPKYAGAAAVISLCALAWKSPGSPAHSPDVAPAEAKELNRAWDTIAVEIARRSRNAESERRKIDSAVTPAAGFAASMCRD